MLAAHETNNISQNCSSITLGFREVAKYFGDFLFCFQYFQKMTAKFQFHLNRFKISVSFEQIQNFKVSNLAMAKVKKINIAVTLCCHSCLNFVERQRPTLEEKLPWDLLG
jgi:hypothetical protein